MARLPMPLIPSSPQKTPVTAPGVFAMPLDVVPENLNIPSMSPVRNQFQPSSKLQFTGRGISVHFDEIASNATLYWYQVYTSDPIPIRGFVRQLTWFANPGLDHVQFIPFCCNQKIQGAYYAPDLPDVQRLIFGPQGLNNLIGAATFFTGNGNSALTLNYVLPNVGIRLGIALFTFISGPLLYSFNFEVLEIE